VVHLGVLCQYLTVGSETKTETNVGSIETTQLFLSATISRKRALGLLKYFAVPRVWGIDKSYSRNCYIHHFGLDVEISIATAATNSARRQPNPIKSEKEDRQ